MVTAITISVVVVLAAIGATYGGKGGGAGADGKVDIRSLEPFNGSDDGGFNLADGQATLFSDFYIVPIPEEIGEIVIILVNAASLEVTWQDEPDMTRLMITWENQPDTVRAMLADHEGTFDEADEKANPMAGEGRIALRWDGGDTYIGSAWARISESEWGGVDGWDYVDLKGGTVVWKDAIDAMVILVQSGDCTNQRIPYVFADDGNVVEATYTLAGYSLTIPPPG